MKKALLLVGTLLFTVTVACGPQGIFTDEDPDPLQVSQAALTVQNCTALPASSIIASGSETGNPATNATDDRLDTRWSNLGKGSWIDIDLGSVQSISGAAIAWHQGNTRTNSFILSASSDGMSYSQVYSGTSTGTTTSAETYKFSTLSTRRLRVTVTSSSTSDWMSIAEMRVCSGTTTTPPPATAVWTGNFETGDRTQWSGAHMVNADRLQVVSSPLREGRYAMKVTVKQGDNPISASGNRNELYRMTHEAVGSEYYYRWSTMFAADFPSPNTWQVFTQWHHEGSSGSPPIEFVVNNGNISLNCSSTQVWKAPLVRGVWQDFIFHVKWSPNASTGFVELYHNGQLVLPKRSCATQFSGMLNYLKMGLYRNSTIAPVGVLYHDGFTMGKQLSDVQPQGVTLSTSAAAVSSASDE
ncbi:heparin lyase I family protein [Hyalangium versicolor]|uniref:heparin lyase I family protein n=1 Tax=Hyalangium versicolor TaxID=2861190 RepID=UPI001CCEE9E5|nr:heparin lyase I family protein [Hyalangium versicolor]